MTLPLHPPIKPMLAKLEPEIPTGSYIYDPKWDGFRSIAYIEDGQVELRSRTDRPMARYFPEICELLGAELKDDCVLDGEIIMPSEDGLDFDSLQLRLHPAASRVEKLSAEIPTSFVAFDVLAQGSTDLRPAALGERLEVLDELLEGKLADHPGGPATAPATRLFLTHRTTDPDTAAQWFDDLEKVHLDGIIAKRPGDSYQEGKRGWVKVKHRRTAECVVGGYRLHKNGGVGSLLLGLYEDGELGYVGHTSSFKAGQRKDLEKLLEPLRTERSFSGDWGPGGESRWQAGKDTDWVAIEPVLVCEVSYDFIQSGYRFRHAATFITWRDDKRPEDCTFDQVRT